MIQGDHQWRRLAGALHEDDAECLALHNAHAQARASGVLDASAGAVPTLGAVTTAPVILLCAHPELDAATLPDAYRFTRHGWPLAALHPDAPAGLADRWGSRLASLVSRFGAQHVAHSVAAIYLTPWPSTGFGNDVALPSRRRTLELATRASERDAAFVIVDAADTWLAHGPIAALPPSRRCVADLSTGTDLDAAALGVDTWEVLNARIAVHAWL